MVSVLSRKLFTELEANLVDTDHCVENLRLLNGKHIVKFFKALVRRESFWLNFIFVCLFVE